jgi:hypothetical protein
MVPVPSKQLSGRGLMEHRLSTQFHAGVFGYTGVDDVEITAEEFSRVNIAFLGPQWAAHGPADGIPVDR